MLCFPSGYNHIFSLACLQFIFSQLVYFVFVLNGDLERLGNVVGVLGCTVSHSVLEFILAFLSCF